MAATPTANILTGMTFLQLCQTLVEICGISGTGPAAVTSQAGEMKRVVGWIARAWIDIQEVREDWQWMRKSVSFQTVAQQPIYSAVACGAPDLARWCMDSRNCTFRTYDTAVGVASEIFMEYLPYDVWRDTYQYGSMRLSYSRPLQITYTPDYSIAVGQTPDISGYTIVGDYFSQPSALVANTDVPTMPARFHMAIIYLAQMYYAEYEEDDYLRTTAEKKYLKILSRMTAAQLPEVTFGRPLA